MSSTQVIVIGSGASGLAAVRRLMEAGVKVVCVEAADRIGGRVNTVDFADGVVDLGAAFIEGDKDNILYEWGKAYDLIAEPVPISETYILSNGETVPTDEVKKFTQVIEEIIKGAEKNGVDTIKDYVMEMVNQTPQLQNNPKIDVLLEWYARQHELGGDEDPKLGKSLRGVSERQCAGPVMMWKAGGMGVVLDILMSKYPDPSKQLPMDIQLKKEVDSIKWKTNDNVQVTFKDGTVMTAKSVISTISVGVMKERHSTLFDPELPLQKLEALNGLQMYLLDKIFIEFAAPWWKTSPAKINVIWRNNDKLIFSGEEAWVTHVYGFDTVAYQKNVLVGWINDHGARLMEKTTEDDVKKGVEKLLKILFPEVTPVKTVLRTKWLTNRWERGTYSYRCQYTEEMGTSAEALSQPICVEGFPRICFAGEATSRYHYGSVQGAIESGFREADRVIKSLNNK